MKIDCPENSDLSRTVFKTAKQNKIVASALVSSNLFTELNALTELTNNFDSVSCIALHCRTKKFLIVRCQESNSLFQNQIF